MPDKKITDLVDGGAPQAADEFVIARAGDNFKVDYASLESEALTDAVIINPAASARNVIVPTAGTVIAAIVKAHAAQSVDLMQWQTSTAAVLASIGETGATKIAPTADVNVLNLVPFADNFANDLAVLRVPFPGDPALTARAFRLQTMNMQDFWGGVSFTFPGKTVASTVPDYDFGLLVAASVLSPGGGGSSRGSIQFDGSGLVTAAATPDGFPSFLVEDSSFETLWMVEKGWMLAKEMVDPAAPAANFAYLYPRDNGGGLTQWCVRFPTGSPYVLATEGDGAIYRVGGTDVALADGGTGASLADPGADRIMFWDDSAGAVTWLTPGTGLTITDTTIDASGGAPSTATYITQTPDGGLSAEQALSALATGLVKNTTGTGVLSIGVANTDYAAATHASRHENGGADEISLAGLSGEPADTVNKSLYDANTVLAADSDNTPAAVTMGASTILARLAAGNIKAATPAELRTLLDVPTNAEAILDTLIDAKGDLIVGTAADTPARLAVGADGKRPVADANSAAGLQWTRPWAQTSYISTVYYGYMGQFTAAAGGFALNTLYCVPIYIGRRQAFDRIGLRAGGGTATLVVRLGIWSGDDGPTTLILDAGTIDGASAAADKTIVISQTLDPGIYWLGGAAQVAASMGSFIATKSGGNNTAAPGLWRADVISGLSRSWARASISGAFGNLVSVAADFAQGQEGMAVMLRAA